jgi:hypothetical protein
MAGKRILLVTGFFPPFSPLGAVRAPALVNYWQALGHQVRVVAIDNPAIAGKLECPLPAEHVAYAPFTPPGESFERLLRPLLRQLRTDTPSVPADGGTTPSPPAPARPPRFRALRHFYQHAVQFPDRYRNWIAPAVAAGLDLVRGWQPDVIYSSGPPHSGHVVAGRLAQRLGAPWVAELRDTWANNPYSDAPRVIEAAQTLYANRVLGRAAAAVLLTETAEAEVKAALGCPTIVSYNGFTEADFAGLDQVPPLDPQRLTILHAGVIYVGRRDPVSLFQALAILGPRRHAVRVKFYHDQMEAVARRAERLGVADCIEICAPVPRRDILRIEREADVLLLCRWADPRDDGVIPGKLFEYIGARRPILAVGSTTGEAAAIVRQGGFGLVSNEPMAIAEQLSAWIEAKRGAGGRLPDLPAPPTRAYLREAQFRRIDPLLAQVAGAPAGLPVAVAA